MLTSVSSDREAFIWYTSGIACRCVSKLSYGVDVSCLSCCDSSIECEIRLGCITVVTVNCYYKVHGIGSETRAMSRPRCCTVTWIVFSFVSVALTVSGVPNDDDRARSER